MEEGGQESACGGVVIQELQLTPGQEMAALGDGETLTINLEDATQIILQGDEAEGQALQEAVQISPGTYQILTHNPEEISDGVTPGVVEGAIVADADDSVTQIEVPLEMLQEAMEMLQAQGQDIHEGEAIQAAIASIAARHMEATAAKATSEQAANVGGTEDLESIELSQNTDNDGEINSQPELSADVLESAVQEKSLPDTSELEALAAEDCEAQSSGISKVVESENKVVVIKDDFKQPEQSCNIDLTRPKGMVSILKPKEKSVNLPTETTCSLPLITTATSSTVNSIAADNHLTTFANSGNLQSPNPLEDDLSNSSDMFSSQTSSVTDTLLNSNSGDGVLLSKPLEVIPEERTPSPPPPPPPPVPDKRPDLDNPIPLRENMEISVGSKKCVLLKYKDTEQLCAYPLISVGGKKKRGRPKKQVKIEREAVVREQSVNDDTGADKSKETRADKPEEMGESQADAVESLLELSNAGPDGVRRSGRKRKKARTLREYAVMKGSSDEDTAEESDEEFRMSDLDLSSSDDLLGETDDEEYKPNRPVKKRKPNDINSNPTFLLKGQKRGPGRPRRSPHPGQPANPAQIPALLVNGQTIMIQGLENLTPGGRPLAPLLAKPPDGVNPGQHVVVINNNADGTPNGTEQIHNGLEIPTSVAQTANGQATILQFSDEVVNMLTKKDPVKLGLKAPESDLEKLKCSVCDFQAFYQQQYAEHLQTHSEDIHRCKCCQYITLSTDEISQHYKDHHPKSICSVCDFTAEQPYVVKRHMSRHDKKICTCQICGKVYKDQYIMRMHVKQVHMPAEVLYECRVCSKKFTRKAHLKRHLRIHEVDKPFKCPLCDYRGCEKSDVTKHMLTHEEPKFSCEICGKAFRHIKNKELHVKRHSGQKDYKCGICDTYGYTFSEIRKHIESQHCDIKTSEFICDKCGAPFADEQSLVDHHSEGCDPMTFEQALSITTEDGEAGQATIQIPASILQGEGQPITYDGQHITIGGNQVNITVQHMDSGVGEESILLTEEQLAEAQIAVTEGDPQAITTAQMVNELVEAGLARVTHSEEAELTHVSQSSEVEAESIDQAIVISAAQTENGIILTKEDENHIILTQQEIV